MTVTARTGDQPVRSWLLNTAVLCVAGILLNVLGAQAAVALKLPVYIDSLGTILAAMLGGYIPAIVVGYATNLINCLSNSVTVYYGIISVLIAVSAAFFAERGWFKKLPFTLLSIIIFALIGGGLGSILTFFLFGEGIGDGVSAPFAQQLYLTGSFSLFGAQFTADLFIDFIDKTLVVLFATLLYHLVPEELLAKLDFRPWQQSPLLDEELEATLHTKPRRMSLRTKFVIIVAAIMMFVAFATTAISYLSFHRSIIETESANAAGITSLMSKVVDPNQVEDFLAEGENAPGFKEAEAELAKIRDSYDDVQYVYVYQIQEDGCHVVLDPDTADEPGSDPGSVVEFDEAFAHYLPDLLEGKEIEPVISNETYGWLLTIYTPLKNSSGDTVCYLAADISMDRIAADESAFLAQIIALFAAFFILVCGIVLWLAKYGIILPVNSISRVSNNFMLNTETVRGVSAEQIDNLDIHTGDEIENLYAAVNQMSHEAVHYIEEAQDKNETIARMQENLIMVMADLVESRDKFTGDHVRNTATYTMIAMNQMRREGIYPDLLTNEFISNVYKSAPLHDVGKIVVSDTILNKPGRFTDEEFEIMKRHTIAGKEILESAKGAVSESSYLDEAQNLAAYHHEKWNGTGYPYGLSGEDIPLSARIMAVADVFDALVSKRSYKAGFPIEKAFAIIEEGIGTHFDPLVARAFLHAQDKARAVAERSNEKKRLEEEMAQAGNDARENPSTPDGNAS